MIKSECFLKETILQSFNYAASVDALVLVLGSMPGEESLRQNQYYAHPKNLFWEIMGEMFGFDKKLPYHERLSKLIDNRIALWDVVQQCRRKGSLDSNIENRFLEVNDFSGFFRIHQNIHSVFFNGRKAEELFKRFVSKKDILKSRKLNYYLLPSTSPANASISKKVKLEKWMKVKFQITSIK